MFEDEPQPKTIKMEIPEALLNLQSDITRNFAKCLFEKICAYDTSKMNTKKTEQLKIKVNGTDEFGLFDKIDDSNILNSLYNNLEPSKFGKGTSYAYDESVRKSRETKNVQINRFSALVPEEFAATYDFELYKFVVYGPGDFFAMHTDTPREGLAYSMVYTMNTDFVGGELHFNGIEQGFGGNKIVIFDPVVAHEVREVTSGYKISILLNLFRKELFSLRKMDLKLNSNVARNLFRQIDFRSLGHMNIWFSHPSQEDILEVLDEKRVRYIKAVTSDDQDEAAEVSEYERKFAEEEEESYSEKVDIADVISQCTNKYNIDFVLCNENIIKANLTAHYGGNSPITVSSNYSIAYSKGILIIL